MNTAEVMFTSVASVNFVFLVLTLLIFLYSTCKDSRWRPAKSILLIAVLIFSNEILRWSIMVFVNKELEYVNTFLLGMQRTLVMFIYFRLSLLWLSLYIKITQKVAQHRPSHRSLLRSLLKRYRDTTILAVVFVFLLVVIQATFCITTAIDLNFSNTVSHLVQILAFAVMIILALLIVILLLYAYSKLRQQMNKGLKTRTLTAAIVKVNHLILVCCAGMFIYIAYSTAISILIVIFVLTDSLNLFDGLWFPIFSNIIYLFVTSIPVFGLCVVLVFDEKLNRTVEWKSYHDLSESTFLIVNSDESEGPTPSSIHSSPHE